LLVAILSIDEVIQVIRTSDEADAARTRLMQVFDLSADQAEYILELRLRRLTKFSKIELDAEAEKLRSEIEQLLHILNDESALRELVGDEMDAIAKTFGDARRTVLRSETEEVKPVSAAKAASVSAELADTECFVTLTASGLIARSSTSEISAADTKRSKHDGVTKRISTSTRKDLGFLTSNGVIHRIHVGDVPSTGDDFDANSAQKIDEFLGLKGEALVGMFDISSDAEIVVGTRQGVVKRVLADYPARDEFEVISLKDGDQVVGADLATGASEFIFITSDAQLLRFDASSVRAQGRSASGVAGVNLSAEARVVAFAAVTDAATSYVITAANSSAALAGTDAGSAKVSSLDEFPAKGRATGGVRAHKFIRTEDQLYFAALTLGAPLACSVDGKPLEIAEPTKRDSSGTQLASVIYKAGSR
jgi:DNA gyrase subunit A